MAQRHGQTVLDYALLVAVVTAVAVSIQVYAKRGIQATVKMASDRMSPATLGSDPEGERAQLAGMRYESGERTNKVFAVGSPLRRFGATRTEVHQVVNKRTGVLEGDAETDIVKDVTTTKGAVTSQENLAASRAAHAAAGEVTKRLQQQRRRFPSLDLNTVSSYAETIIRVHPSDQSAGSAGP